ncbi:hypothetical protein BDW68DRAFT_90686 [Aspergillus falconensis]
MLSTSARLLLIRLPLAAMNDIIFSHLSYTSFFRTVFSGSLSRTEFLIHRCPNVGRFSFVSVSVILISSIPRVSRTFSFWPAFCFLSF